MNFIRQHLLQRFYIHLPSFHEFYLPALASKILYSLTWCLWILSTGTCPKILYSLKYPSPSTMNFIPKKSFHFPGGQGHEIYEHEKPGLCWQDFFLTLCPKNYPSRTFIQPQLWHFQSSVGLSHGKIFSDTGVATKEKCGTSRSKVCWRLQKDKQDFGHLNFIQICFAPEPL